MDKIKLFGCSLDPDEREQRIKQKREYALSKESNERENKYLDPYDIVENLIGVLEEIEHIFKKSGKVGVESWLTPFPLKPDFPLLTVSNFVSFIDTNGCYEYAEEVCKFTENNVFDDIPLLVGVDHSLTGGVLKALSKEYGNENILVLFLDSHFDGVSLPKRLDLIHHNMEKGIGGVFRKDDPYLYGREDSYNVESFIKFLLNDQIILPENTACIGATNYPSSEALKSEDPRVTNYVREFTEQEEKGLTIIKKEDIRKNLEVLKNFFETRDFEYIYVSADMDIGANATTQGVRFANGYIGIEIDNIRRILRGTRKWGLEEGTLIGLDLMEIDMYECDESTYALALTILKELLSNVGQVSRN